MHINIYIYPIIFAFVLFLMPLSNVRCVNSSRLNISVYKLEDSRGEM